MAELRLYTNRSIYLQSDSFQIIPAFIEDDYSFNTVSYTDITYQFLHGEENILVLNASNLIFNMLSPGSVVILVKYTTSASDEFIKTLNLEIVTPLTELNQGNFYDLIIQELPQSYDNNQYNNLEEVNPVYADNQASALVLSNLYNSIYNIFGELFPDNGYTGEWEYALNGTSSIFANLATAKDLLVLLYQAYTVTSLNIWDLELFLSKYIYLRTGISTCVYINDNTINFKDYWILGFSQLGVNTKLAPALDHSGKCNIIIFNTFSDQIQSELETLIQRYMRADVTYSLIFTNNTPTEAPYSLTSAGYTYNLDPRLLFRKALQYTAGVYPFNILGYYA